MGSIADELAKRDRFVRRRWATQTWAERLADLDRLQEQTWETLIRSPDGYRHFLRRNFRARAIRVEVSDVQ